ncbi:MAG: methionine--tRNA ligase [Candidatus Cloacimonadota bacterium]|nr:methionine--tRNA ligase [Candidatus Cloacimonadota bacterium]
MSKSKNQEKYLVTSALPYANGDLHIGQIAGAYLPADIFVRYLKLKGENVLYICGTDEHGAPISIKAEAEGITPQELVDKYHKIIKKSFKGLEINFDNFSGTARPINDKLSQEFFLNLYNKGYIEKKISQQFYCEHDKRFLSDRYVEGICPNCGAEGARGDQCDSCGKLIETIKLGNPVCKICGNTPIIKETTHWYLNLPKFENKLKKWLDTKKYWKENVRNFILGWIKSGLKERAITRDINWGVPVPLEDAKGKVLYVWFDAPIGYISSTIEWAEKIGKPEKWKEYWLDPQTKMIHFLGKDNIPFHTIIWPSMLMEQEKEFILPYDVPANEYLNIQGEKISTSRNLAVWVGDYLKYFDGELLRYVLAAIAPENKDSDFTWSNFQIKVNSELANILGNLANRVFTFSKRYFGGVIQKPNEFSELSQTTLIGANEIVTEIDEAYSNYQVRKAAKLCLDIARLGNKYFDETKPWEKIKKDKNQAAETLYVCSELLRKISIVLSPILPRKMQELHKMMNLPVEDLWDKYNDGFEKIHIDKIQPLFAKIDDQDIEKQEKLLAQKIQDRKKKMDHKEEITYEDFSKMEIRVATIISANRIKRSNKLTKLILDLGEEKRQIVAGISKDYSDEELIGKKIALLVNLKKIKLMGVESNGMLLAANTEDECSLLILDKDIPAGSVIS